MTQTRHIVVAGASQAGLACAAALRGSGFDGAITMVGEEVHPPYTRPPLSKGVLTGAESHDSVFLGGQEDVDLLPGTAAVGVDVVQRCVTLDNGDRLYYDGLVIATGARARRLAPDHPGEITLRTLDDAVRLREALMPAREVAIAGGGFLGMEIASAAAALGKSVTVVDLVAPLVDRLGPVLADMCLAAAAEHGVKVRVSAGGVRVGFDGDTPTRLISTDGAVLAEADVVITAAGDVPNTEWLRHSGLPLHGGVIVDSCCRVAPHVVAAGDVAAAQGRGGRPRRLPHWSNAMSQAKIAATSLIGAQAAGGDPTAPQFFWTEMFGLSLRLAGQLPPVGVPTVLQGSFADRRAVLVWPATATHLGTAATINTPLSAPKLIRLANNTTQQLRTVR